jgi:threonine aldolase
LDGARVWECTPFFGRSASEIARLADSIYVSLYKGLGGIAGAVLAGPEPFIHQTRVWRQRHGGLLKSVFPLIAAARQGVAKHLPKMGAYVETANRLALALNQIEGVTTVPVAPQVNAFQIHFPASAARMQAAHLAFAAKHRIWLFDGFRDAERAGWCHADVTIGDALQGWGRQLAFEAVGSFVASALEGNP